MAYVIRRDDEASKLGMWLFLFTELLLFGGLFIVYSVYRFKNADAFATAAHEHLDIFWGTVNTLVLITSSFTAAISITALQKGNSKLAIRLLIFTLLCAAAFMVIKYFEWSHKIHLGIYPGSPTYGDLTPGEGLFFLLYYFMTGLHGLHVIIGAIVITVVIFRIKNGKVSKDNFSLHENAGLYWHLVDLIWIFLFPLFYLIS